MQYVNCNMSVYIESTAQNPCILNKIFPFPCFRGWKLPTNSNDLRLVWSGLRYSGDKWQQKLTTTYPKFLMCLRKFWCIMPNVNWDHFDTFTIPDFGKSNDTSTSGKRVWRSLHCCWDLHEKIEAIQAKLYIIGCWPPKLQTLYF